MIIHLSHFGIEITNSNTVFDSESGLRSACRHYQNLNDSDNKGFRKKFLEELREVDLRKDEPGWSMPPLNRFR